MKHNSAIILITLLFSTMLFFGACKLQKDAVSEIIPSEEVVVQEAIEECSSETPEFCKTESECINIGANWCEDYCTTDECHECKKETPEDCRTESECVAVGAKWCEDPKTSLEEGDWYCSSYCAGCRTETLEECKSESECIAAGGSWCEESYSDEEGTHTNWYCSNDCSE